MPPSDGAVLIATKADRLILVGADSRGHHIPTHIIGAEGRALVLIVAIDNPAFDTSHQDRCTLDCHGIHQG